MDKLIVWLNVGLVLGPVLVMVHRQCKAANMGTALPIAGLLAGILLEIRR